jgi:hypothetical protein
VVLVVVKALDLVDPPADGWESALGFSFAPDDGPDAPGPIAARLVATVDRFRALDAGNARMVFVLRMAPKIQNEKSVIGELWIPRFQGGLAGFASALLTRACGGVVADYVMVIDAEWWAAMGATPRQREILVYHELCHGHHKCDKEGELRFNDDGSPVWGLVGHDVEEFNDLARAYGDWSGNLVGFARAVWEGEARAR